MNRDEILLMIDKAIEIREQAYAEYSGFMVGSVVKCNDNLYSGVNVENKSYGLTICAERSAIYTAISNGERLIDAIAVVADVNGTISPCGACREVIMEFSDENTLVIMSNLNREYIVKTAYELLPYGFTFKKGR